MYYVDTQELISAIIDETNHIENRKYNLFVLKEREEGELSEETITTQDVLDFCAGMEHA